MNEEKKTFWTSAAVVGIIAFVIVVWLLLAVVAALSD